MWSGPRRRKTLAWRHTKHSHDPHCHSGKSQRKSRGLDGTCDGPAIPQVKRESKMSDKSAGVALITGANRGIGFEVCRQFAARGFTVVLTARDADKARAAAAKLKSVGHVEPAVLDVSDARSIKEAAAEISHRH